MSFVQRLFRTILRPSCAAAMEAESRTWRLRCSRGHERSVWEAGGIRWGATGSPRQLLRCPTCRAWRWHTFFREHATPAPPAPPRPEAQ